MPSVLVSSLALDTALQEGMIEVTREGHRGIGVAII